MVLTRSEVPRVVRDPETWRVPPAKQVNEVHL